jgi:hypothetical protein
MTTRNTETEPLDADEIVDLEITVKMIIPQAVSRADLERHYKSEPLRCAKQLIKTGGLLGSTSKKTELLTAKVKES